KWMVDGCALLKTCPGGSDEWAALVEGWITLETAYGFKTGVSIASLRAPSRPVEVGDWIKNGWSTTRETEVKNLETLKAHWWMWWTALCPTWRKQDEHQWPLTGEELGSWGILVHPGQNGMLIVLLPLLWWRIKEGGDVASDSWLRAVRDVTWVCKRLLLATTDR
ncbi:hypothetical protein B0H10DRAFT_1850008, partial [Mycena sp. CBHHK59/15]